MKCPICGQTVRPGTDRCGDCGYRCQTTTTYTFQPEPESPRRGPKGLGCCIGVGIALVLVLLLLSLGLRLLVWNIGFEVMTPETYYPDAETAPYAESILPDSNTVPEASEDCFSIQGHAVTFLPDQWDGGSVLRVPEYVDGQQVLSLAPGRFQDCTELTTILLPDSLTEIDRMAFSGCTNLRGLFIPEGCLSIGSLAFSGCISMEAVYIPSTMARMTDGCFDDCASLRLLFYAGNFEQWNELYDDYITPFTTAACYDGYFYHGAGR